MSKKPRSTGISASRRKGYRPPMNEGDQRVAHNIRRLRLGAGLPLHRIAEAIGVSFQIIHRAETAAKRVSADELFVLSVLFNVSIDEFFEPIEDAPRPRGHERVTRAITLMRAAHRIEDLDLLEALVSMSRALVIASARRKAR